MGRYAGALTVMSLAHAAVDASCATMLVWSAVTGRLSPAEAVLWFLLYNVTAFALQPVLGLGVDVTGATRAAALAGVLLVAGAWPLALAASWVRVAAVVAGLGNALFHVAGGAVSLRISPGTAAAPGIFVAPGAAGLALGLWLGRAGIGIWWPAAALLALAIPIALVALPSTDVADHGAPARSRTLHGPRVDLAVALLLLVVAGRSLTGFALALPWKAQLPLLVAVTAAIVLGKAAGGLLADRFGRARVGVGALVVAGPLLVFAPTSPLAGILGMLALNMTMPVTLVALADVVPAYPGLAFGMASLAIVAGGFPAFARLHVAASGWVPTLGLVWGAAAALAVSLAWLSPRPARLGPVRSATMMEATE